MTVKFNQQHTQGTLYNKGDVAGFDAATEEHLVDKLKVADKVAPKAATKPAA